RGKHLIIVPSGPLTTLPFQVLITTPPNPEVERTARYRDAAWLVLQQPVTVLPSVGSLQALRKVPPSHAKEPYIAFGNPLLLGPGGNARRAWEKQRCANQPMQTQVAKLSRVGISLRAIDLEELSKQVPLPETADELCAVAEALGSLRQEQESIW